MKEYELKYGCNPNQHNAAIFMSDGAALPIEIINGRPGYINFLDALNSWQLVKELKEATGWKYTFRNLPKTTHGSRIRYSVSEDPVAGYTCEINGFTIVNKHVPETISLSVRKLWNDDNNAQGLRPERIFLTLNGGKVVVALSAANNWQATVSGLPKRENGAEIHYTLDGSAPTSASALYIGSITLTDTTTVKAVAVKDGVTSEVASMTFTKSSGNGDGTDFD